MRCEFSSVLIWAKSYDGECYMYISLLALEFHICRCDATFKNMNSLENLKVKSFEEAPRQQSGATKAMASAKLQTWLVIEC